MEIDNPSRKQLVDLRLWFWKTSYSNYFTVNSLSNQRKAFRQFITYLHGDAESMLFIAPNQQLEVAPYPERLILSSVRNKTLILFELNHYLELTNKKPKGPLTMEKLIEYHDITPPNVVPFFGQHSPKENNKDFIDTIKKVNVAFDKLYFIPSESLWKGKENEKEILLRERIKLICQCERKFVQSLGDIHFPENS